MRLLITGSKGLIGTALKKILYPLGIEVVGIDHQFDVDHPEFGDILDTNALFSAAENVDGIIHLAAVSRVITGEKNPALCWKTNVEGTRNVVDAAIYSSNKPWVLYASSREVYGEPKSFPVSESAPLSPVNIYGESKIAAEQIVEKARDQGIQTAIVRFSNVYGSVHDYHDRVIPAFCRAAAFGSDITVEGGNNLFDFTYIEDVAQGVLSLVNLLMQGQTLPPIHLTTGQASSLAEVAQIAKEASVHSINIVEGTPRSFDVAKFWGDTNRAQEVLHWKASVSVYEGMRRLINQYSVFLISKIVTKGEVYGIV